MAVCAVDGVVAVGKVDNPVDAGEAVAEIVSCVVLTANSKDFVTNAEKADTTPCPALSLQT